VFIKPCTKSEFMDNSNPMFFDDTLLSAMAAKPRYFDSPLQNLAIDRALYEKEIAQFNSLFELMPTEAREDTHFQGHLKNPKREQFFGAIDMCVANRLFRELGLAVEYEPMVDGKRPDFRVGAGNSKQLVEVFGVRAPSSDVVERLGMELNEIDTAFWVLVEEYNLDDTGNIHGIGRQVKSVLDDFRDNPDPAAHFSVSTLRGASLRFTVLRKGPGSPRKGCLGSWDGDGGWGDPAEKALKNSIKKKLKKYKFPFQLVIVTDGFHPTPRTIYNLFLGDGGQWKKPGDSYQRIESIIVIHIGGDEQGIKLRASKLLKPTLTNQPFKSLSLLPDLLPTSFGGYFIRP